MGNCLFLGSFKFIKWSKTTERSVLNWFLLKLLVFHIKTKDYCIQLAKARGEQISWKAPPPSFLPLGEILGSYHGTWCNFTHCYFMHHWTSHWWQLARKAPPQDEGKFFDIRSIHFRPFPATLVFVAEKPPPSKDEGNFLTSDLSISGNFKQL